MLNWHDPVNSGVREANVLVNFGLVFVSQVLVDFFLQELGTADHVFTGNDIQRFAIFLDSRA